jgi:hypothetical protein
MRLHGHRNRTNLVTRRGLLRLWLAPLIVMVWLLKATVWLIMAMVHTYHHAQRRARRGDRLSQNIRSNPAIQTLSRIIHEEF